MANVTTDLSFPIGDTDQLAEIAWSKIAHVETQFENFFNQAGMSAKAKGRMDANRRQSGVPVIIQEELGAEPGKEVRIPLRRQLSRTPRVDENGASTLASTTYGDTSMLGNEEALIYHDLTVKLGLLKHSTGHNSPDFYYHRTSLNLQEDSEDALQDWLIQNHEEAMVDACYEQLPYFVQQQLTVSAVAHPRVVYAGGVDNQDQMDEALSALEAGPLDPEEVERMRRIGDHIYGRYRPNFSDKGDGQPVDTKSTAA